MVERKTIAVGILVVFVISVFALTDPFHVFTPEEIIYTTTPGATGCGHRPGFPEDGVYSINEWYVETVDELNEYGAVTADDGHARLASGVIKSASSYASGETYFKGMICEGDTILVEIDSSTNYYTTQATFVVTDITAGDTHKTNGKYLGTVPMRGMDPSSDAGVIKIDCGVDTLWNGTHEEDQKAATAGETYSYEFYFDWQAADDEFFGITHMEFLSGDQYTYAPYIEFNVTLDTLIDNVEQDGDFLTKVEVKDSGSFRYYIYEMNPVAEDETTTKDGKTTITFDVTWPNASGDTLEVNLYDESRVDMAEDGIMSQTAVESAGPMTTT